MILSSGRWNFEPEREARLQAAAEKQIDDEVVQHHRQQRPQRTLRLAAREPSADKQRRQEQQQRQAVGDDGSQTAVAEAPLEHHLLPHPVARGIGHADLHQLLLGLGTGAHLASSTTGTSRRLQDTHANALALNRLHHAIVADNLIIHTVFVTYALQNRHKGNIF